MKSDSLSIYILRNSEFIDLHFVPESLLESLSKVVISVWDCVADLLSVLPCLQSEQCFSASVASGRETSTARGITQKC